MLDGVLVVDDVDRLDAWQLEAGQIRYILAAWVVPEHDAVVLETPLQVGSKGGDIAHSPTSSPGIFFSAAPSFG